MGRHPLEGGFAVRFAAVIWVVGHLVAAEAARGADLFSDQTAAQGVEFTHHSIPNDRMNFGAGAAWGDFDADGDMDLYVADQVGLNSLFMNLGGGVGFIDVAADYGVEDPEGTGNGALWGDYDNDGDADLYVLNRGDNIMFRNDGPDGNGGWLFTDVTAEIGAGAFGRSIAAAYGDYDNDGWLDLYVATHSFPSDRLPEPGDPDRRDFLLHNVEGTSGQRVFVDVAADLFGGDVLDDTIAHSVGFLDFDNDEDLDIYVVNEELQVGALLCAFMWRNDGSDGSDGWQFTDVADQVGATLCSNPMGLAIGDYNNDGWLDMAATDFGPNHLFKNNRGMFTDVAEQAGVDRPIVPGLGNTQFGWGLVFLDYDLDGYEDLFVATGRGGLDQQPNPLFHNDGNPPANTFTEVTDVSGCAYPEDNSHTVIKADYDGDGDEDLYVVSHGGEARLCRNDQQGGDFLILKLVGGVSNRDAIGARVKISAAGLPDQYRMVQSGSTTGGSHELALFFGVTGATVVSSVVIDWPSGLDTILSDVAINQRLTIWEIPPAPVVVAIEGPTLVSAQGTASYTAHVTYDNDVTEDATDAMSWTVVTGNSFATFTAPGQLSTFDIAPSSSETIEIQAALGTVQAVVAVTIEQTVVDTEPPSIVITGPTMGGSLSTTDKTVTLSGTTEDNAGIVAVAWSTDQGYSGPCAGLDSWTTGPIPLIAGVNVVTLTARDGLQNEANTILSVIYTAPEPPVIEAPEPPIPVPPLGDETNPSPTESPDSTPGTGDDSDTGGSAGAGSEADGATEPIDSTPADNQVPEGDDGTSSNGDLTIPTASPTGVCGALALFSLPIIVVGFCALRRLAT